MDDKPVKLISIVCNMHHGAGHHYPYHVAVTRAAKLNGWEHIAACTSDEKRYLQLADNWHPCLYKGMLYRSLGTSMLWVPVKTAFKVYGILRFGVSLVRFLRAETDRNKHTVLLVDDPAVPHLIALAVALLLVPRGALSVWPLYRTMVHEKFLRGETLRLLHRFMGSLLQQPERFRLLTDSDQLLTILSDYFKRPIKLLPIPHLDVPAEPARRHQSSRVVCWWPGTPRVEKGQHVLQTLARRNAAGADRITLVVPEEAGIEPIAGGPEVVFVRKTLPRAEYVRWLSGCDMVLLPYNAAAYRGRTSGVFTEAVSAERIPLVTDDTWMAKELRKFGLEDLIVDWNDPDLFERVVCLHESAEIAERIKRMRDHYLDLHGHAAYSNVLRDLVKGSTQPATAAHQG